MRPSSSIGSPIEFHAFRSVSNLISLGSVVIFNKYTQDGIYKGQSTGMFFSRVSIIEDSKHMHSCLLDSFKYISSYVDECFYPAILDRIQYSLSFLKNCLVSQRKNWTRNRIVLCSPSIHSTPSITETLVSSPAAPSKTSPSKTRKTSKRTSEVQKESKKTNSLFNYFQSKN